MALSEAKQQRRKARLLEDVLLFFAMVSALHSANQHIHS